MSIAVTWLGHASLLIIVGGMKLLIDPFEVKNTFTEDVDVILFTHSHYDHFSQADYDYYKERGIYIDIGPHDLKDKLGDGKHLLLQPEQQVKVKVRDEEITVKAIPAYNIGKKFHPKANGWLGYLISYKGKSLYIAGDTDFIPEMEKISCDVAFLPVGGTYTMTAAEAAKAAIAVKAKVAVPIHYGKIVGSAADGEAFVREVGKSGKILKEGRAVEF